MQIRITEEQAACLRALSSAQGTSVAELVRQGINCVIRSGGVVSTRELRARAAAVAGRFRSGKRDAAHRHDRHLGEAFGS